MSISFSLFTDLRHFNTTPFIDTKSQSRTAQAIVIAEELQKLHHQRTATAAAEIELVQVTRSSVPEERQDVVRCAATTAIIVTYIIGGGAARGRPLQWPWPQ